MKHRVAIFLFLMMCLVVSCDKAPNGVIPESKMEPLLVDLELAEAYIESHWDQFPDDSSKLVLKQSVFAKHDVTPELYDTSLVWYARNMDVYIKVYDNVIGRLQELRENSDKAFGPGQLVAERQQSAHRKSYGEQGDTADIWTGTRRWVLTSGMHSGFIPFDFVPDKERASGDKYEFAFKLKPVRSNFRAFIAVDYVDGASTLVNRYGCNDNWNSIAVQSDSTRQVRRIYGYLYYNMIDGDVAYVDSMMLLRTHLDRETYSPLSGQNFIERKKRETTNEVKTSSGSDNKQPVEAIKQPKGTYKPKEGVNKSSASRHVTESPNSEHMPRR